MYPQIDSSCGIYDFAGGNKKSETHDFQKGLQFHSISTNSIQNHFHRLKVSPWIIYLFLGFLNDVISFQYLGIYLGKTGVIEWVQ